MDCIHCTTCKLTAPGCRVGGLGGVEGEPTGSVRMRCRGTPRLPPFPRRGFCNCSADWHGAACETPCPGLLTGSVCSGHGQCTAAMCLCHASFRGPACEKQCPGPLDSPCHGHGTCDSLAECTCFLDWWSPDCHAPCPSANGLTCAGRGTCDWGAYGAGNCTCLPGYYGPACDQECPGGAGNPCSGRGTCDEGNIGSGVCMCTLSGYWGPACENECLPSAANPCNGKGICSEGSAGTGNCTCHMERGLGFWGGVDCTDCMPLYWGANCDQRCPDCNGRGTCSAGVAGLGYCMCNPGTWGNSMNGYVLLLWRGGAR